MQTLFKGLKLHAQGPADPSHCTWPPLFCCMSPVLQPHGLPSLLWHSQACSHLRTLAPALPSVPDALPPDGYPLLFVVLAQIGSQNGPPWLMLTSPSACSLQHHPVSFIRDHYFFILTWGCAYWFLERGEGRERERERNINMREKHRLVALYAPWPGTNSLQPSEPHQPELVVLIWYCFELVIFFLLPNCYLAWLRCKFQERRALSCVSPVLESGSGT